MDKTSLENFIKKFKGDAGSFSQLFAALRGGNNKVLHNCVTQALSLDDSWIIQIESALYSIEQIVHNPRKFIAENELIMDVAKVRRTNSKTVRHLSSHSQFVQNIDEQGEVTPKKLLTVELDEDIAIYENRFICALVKRLITFIERRNRDLEGKLDTYEQTNVALESEFDYGRSKFKCNINLQVKEPPENMQGIEKNKELYGRVDMIRRRLRIIQATPFMKILEKAKPVRPPIQKTNLLAKNVDYNNCYKLWLYISSYTYLGYSIDLQDKFLPVEGDYYDDLTVLAGLSLQSLLSDRVIRKELYDGIEFSEPEEKDFTIVKSYTFHPSFDATKEQSGEETINEYYFRRMKNELVKVAQEDEFAIENGLNVNFTKFFRAISRINDEMYNDLIEDKIKSNGEKFAKTLVEKKRIEIEEQQERIRRRKLYVKLKWEEVERAQRMQERAEEKLEKLKRELYDAKRKTKPVRVKRNKVIAIKKVKKGE